MTVVELISTVAIVAVGSTSWLLEVIRKVSVTIHVSYQCIVYKKRYTEKGVLWTIPLIAFFCRTMPPQKSAHMHMLYNAPSGLRGQCKTGIMQEN